MLFDCWLVASWLMLLLVSVLLVVCCVIYLELLLLGIGGGCLCLDGWFSIACWGCDCGGLFAACGVG